MSSLNLRKFEFKFHFAKHLRFQFYFLFRLESIFTMDFSDFPDDTDEMLDLEAEMMREQARQFEEMNDYEYEEDQQLPTSTQGNSSSSAPTIAEESLGSFVSETTQKTKGGTNSSLSNKARTAQSVLNQQSVDRYNLSYT